MRIESSSSAITEVTVRRKVVDARFLEGQIPANTSPPFDVADGVRCVTPGDLVRVDAPREGFVVIGAGKTAMDTCQYLLVESMSAK